MGRFYDYLETLHVDADKRRLRSISKAAQQCSYCTCKFLPDPGSFRRVFAPEVQCHKRKANQVEQGKQCQAYVLSHCFTEANLVVLHGCLVWIFLAPHISSEKFLSQSTLASLRSLSTNSSTDETMIPPLRLGGSSTFTVCNLGATSTPRSCRRQICLSLNARLAASLTNSSASCALSATAPLQPASNACGQR